MRKITILLVGLGFSVSVWYGCNSYDSKRDQEGEKLAGMYCGSCHLAPSPGLLTKDIWKSNVLPVMSNFMNLHYVGDSVLPLSPDMVAIDSALLPQKVAISPGDFEKIAAYYLRHAPDSLPVQDRKEAVVETAGLFEVLLPGGGLSQMSGGLPQGGAGPVMPFTTAVLIDTVRRSVYQSDAVGKVVNVYDKTLHKTGTFAIGNIATGLRPEGNDLYVTSIGAMKPGPNMQFGNISVVGLDAGSGTRAGVAGFGRAVAGSGGAVAGSGGGVPKLLLDSLSRSVESVEVDLDNDGNPDWLVCEFGFLRGNFCWYRNLGNGKYEKKVIKAVPGAMKVYLEDVDHDGKMDCWVLFGQAKEGISLFLNKGNGHFEEKEILTFPPVYGSSYFELADINHDGKEDIIYTCGDNADYSPILKPYHGVYIYLNTGDFHFKQAYFFPMYGCYKAMAADFDKDGDLDLACIAYFADYDHHPKESFIYLENVGHKDSLRFVPHTIDKAPAGRWICMDVKDLDGDGWPDIVLGNMAAPYHNRRDWQAAWMQAPPFVVLKNTHK